MGWEKRGTAGSDVWQSLLAPSRLWAKDPPAGLQSWTAEAGKRPRLSAASIPDNRGL